MAHYFKPSTWALEPGSTKSGRWSNEDMDPVPPEKRSWTMLNFVAYWISDAWNLTRWQLASSMLAVGLSWRQALPAIAVAHIIIGAVMVLNGTIGARLHISFPIIARSSFGFWFSYFSVISRIVLSMFWGGVQAYNASQCLYQMLKAIWPSIASMPNHLPENAHITTSGMLSYFLLWLVMMPLMFVHPQQIRWLFVVKAVIVPPAMFAIFIWALVKVPLRSGLIEQRSTLSGSALSYAWLSAMNSAMGGLATLAVNIPDFTRYAKNERAQYIQALAVPVACTLVSFIGIAVTSAGVVMYGEILWNPLVMIDRWESRPAAFFVSFAFALAALSTNISANTISAATDLAALFPRYINLRRGQVLVGIVGSWAVVPWEILSSAEGFLSFMGGYTIFLGPFAGIMVADYWIVHRCKVDVPAMYTPHGRYRYTYGTNWRALLTMLLAIPPNIPGLIASINPAVEISGAYKVFSFAWLFGFFVSLCVYSALSLVFPAKETFVGEGSRDSDLKEDELDDKQYSEYTSGTSSGDV
ncbi:NCS1 nucleoside transporter family [Daedaleopsis nitida]|nr:NCS1 nucleoside transporter family [Daedaleopsis nitida]